ncbi:hypothetical protein FSARC_1648 [Fusarium sarcochroum]|uniref:Ubiquitin-related modifier 1 n=1 Tax=Fusarium sarcochroum TaxID=1208366 RepID=A0A8H4XDW9_9HYPO|nr:hypothetical protein FSARC_1648 [Fusarium sarcochroum]
MAEPSSSPRLNIDVEFSGGLEMLFSNKRQHALAIPAADQDGKPADIAYLIDHLCQNVMDDSRKDLFVLDNHLRPGILVLINDADWELEGEEAYEIQSGDNILLLLRMRTDSAAPLHIELLGHGTWEMKCMYSQAYNKPVSG